MIIKIWPWNLLFGINAGIKYQGPDQIYDNHFGNINRSNQHIHKLSNERS